MNNPGSREVTYGTEKKSVAQVIAVALLLAEDLGLLAR